MTEPVPDDASVRRRTWLIAGVLAVVVVLVGVGAAFALMALRSSAVRPATSAVIPSLATSSSVAASGGVSATTSSSPSPTSTASTESTATSTTPPGQIVRSGRIAYRFKGQIWVANEDGTGGKVVVNSTSDDFSLSPDGRTLALMPSSPSTSDHARLIDVDSGVQAILPFAVALPVWAPDSSWVAYTAGNAPASYQIRRANRDGSGDELVKSQAAAPSISPDGSKIAFSKRLEPSTTSTDPVFVYDRTKNTTTAVPKSEGASYYAYASGGGLYFVKGGTDGWLGLADKTLASSSVIASLPVGSVAAAPGPLCPSADGSKVVFAMAGDDGYSRLTVGDAAAHKVTAVNTRRDAYPLRWLLDGSAILYIDGNAVQKQATGLYRIKPDGTGRKLLVDGAGL